MYMTCSAYLRTQARSHLRRRIEMPLVADDGSFTDARSHLEEVFAATARGRTVTVQRDGQLSAVMPMDRLHAYFSNCIAACSCHSGR